MASWITNSVYYTAFAVIICTLLASTSARSESVHKNNVVNENYNGYFDSSSRRYDDNSFSIRNNLRGSAKSYINNGYTSDSRDASTGLKKALHNLKHNLQYHPNDFKYFATNTTTTGTSSNTTTATSPTPAATSPTPTTTKPTVDPTKLAETSGEYKQRGSFPWLLLVLVLTGFILIAALLILTMSKKESYVHGHVTQDFPDHKEQKKNDEELINKEIQDNLAKRNLANAQGA